MADSVVKSMTTGRLLGSLAMTILGGYLATKGIGLSEEDKELGIQLISLSIAAFGSAIPGVISKVRELKKAPNAKPL